MEGLKVFAIWAFVVTPFFFMGDMMINDREKKNLLKKSIKF